MEMHSGENLAPKRGHVEKEKEPLPLLEEVKTDTLVLWNQLVKGTVMEL